MGVKARSGVGPLLGIALLAAALPVHARAQQTPAEQVAAPAIDDDDIGGIVTRGTIGRRRCAIARALPPEGLRQESVHQAAVDGAERIVPAMRPAAVDIVGIVIGRHALRDLGRRQANVGRQAIDMRICSEVRIEAPVLLHDEDEMLDFFEPGGLRADNRAGPG